MALYNGQDTKDKILISERHLFYEKGYEQIIFKDIASHAEINQGSIYYHFKIKSNLGKTIYQEIAKENLQIAENSLTF
ncbi:MAG: TetR/AcrR family transcriptional regulator [Acetobacterium woodii]|nr:TetR/AcrR family transcriptional regulator [Acetobacterium woodii]